MTYKTVEGILHPDGTVTLPAGELPKANVRVMVTLREEDGDANLAELGEYLEQLTDYEERLLRGDVKWQ